MNINPVSIPHLSLSGGDFFYDLEKHILEKQLTIETWFRKQWQATPPMLTCSVDIRNAGFKLSAVDANLFPAGFNNLNPEFLPLSIQAIQNVLLEHYPKCENILIIPENHTRNLYYYESINTLQSIIKQAGYGVRVGSWLIENEPKIITLLSKDQLTLYPIEKQGKKIKAGDFTPCLILLNNDLSEGIPDILKDLDQLIDPLPELGWSTRSKTKHFHFYNKVCNEFSKLINIDEWEICPLFVECDDVDFQSEEINNLVEKTEMLFSQIQAKYNEYNIKSSPFVILKPDQGTYGRGVITLRHPNDIKALNRKQRQDLLIGKGNQAVKRILLQEGIPTIETVGTQDAVAEPVVYLIGQYVIGGFYRLHPTKSEDESLNTPGMQFEPLAFETCCNQPNERLSAHDAHNRFYVYSVIARLSLLATCYERKAIL